MIEPTEQEIEQATAECIADGVVYEVKFLDRDDATVMSCKLGELALERARRKLLERKLGEVQHALEDQARQTGELITTLVNNATSVQQMQVAEMQRKVSDLEREIARRPDPMPNFQSVYDWSLQPDEIDYEPKDVFGLEKRLEMRPLAGPRREGDSDVEEPKGQ